MSESTQALNTAGNAPMASDWEDRKREGEAPCSLGTVTVERASKKALLVQLPFEDEPRWIPMSVIHDDSEVHNESTKEGRLVVKAWFADKEGIA